MPTICESCGRGSGTGQRRSKSNIKTKRRFHVNLQSKRIDGVRMAICTRCLRTRAKRMQAS